VNAEPIFQQQGKDAELWILRLIYAHMRAVRTTLKDMKFCGNLRLTKRVEEDSSVHAVHLLIELGGIDEAGAGVLRDVVYRRDDVVEFIAGCRTGERGD
jgi:hypothetical protein